MLLQVTDANLQLAQLLLAAQLQAPAMQSSLAMLSQAPITGEHPQRISCLPACIFPSKSARQFTCLTCDRCPTNHWLALLLQQAACMMQGCMDADQIVDRQHIMSLHAGLSAGMVTMPTGLPYPAATLQQDMTLTHANDLPQDLQASAQAANGCSGTPEFQACLFDTVMQAWCLARAVVLDCACPCTIWPHLPEILLQQPAV